MKSEDATHLMYRKTTPYLDDLADLKLAAGNVVQFEWLKAPRGKDYDMLRHAAVELNFDGGKQDVLQFVPRLDLQLDRDGGQQELRRAVPEMLEGLVIIRCTVGGDLWEELWEKDVPWRVMLRHRKHPAVAIPVVYLSPQGALKFDLAGAKAPRRPE